jgi:DNA-binding transcriptional LysR family regulator
MSFMRAVHIRNLDLNLLPLLHALLEERHVTRAARRCFLSQPAMSRALERLRELLGDPLLVRGGRTYERTLRGERILRDLESLMPRLEAMVRGEQFDPARSQERFRVALTDHASVVLLPLLAARLRKAALGAKLELLSWRPQSWEDAAAGRIDTVLSAEEAPPVLESEVIFAFDFVCMVGARQRVHSRRLTLKQYLQFPHAVVATLEGRQTLIDRPLAQLGVKRRVALSLPYFFAAMFAVAQTDLVVTVPRRLAKLAAQISNLRIVELPREIGTFPYYMAWHPRLTVEPAHAWFREQLRTAARTI